MRQCANCGSPAADPTSRFCPQCGAPLEPLPATPRQSSSGLSLSAGVCWDIARLLLGFLALGAAFNGTWHVTSDRSSSGPTVLAVIGLIAALVGLVVDVVLQRAVIGEDFDPVLRLGIRAALVATVVCYSAYDLLYGELHRLSATGSTVGMVTDSTRHVWPLVGSGPVLALGGAALVFIGPWKDRFSFSTGVWRNSAATLAGLAAVANCYQAIRALLGARDSAHQAAITVASCATWFAMAAAALVLGWALLTGRRACWPVASVVVPAWIVAFFWQHAFNSSVSAGGEAFRSTVDELAKPYAALGAGLLLVATVLAATPSLSLTADARMSSRWIDAARGGALVTAGALLVIAVMGIAVLGAKSRLSARASDALTTAPLVWIVVLSVVWAAAAVIVWVRGRQPQTGRLFVAVWGTLGFLLLGITMWSSATLRGLVSSDFFALGRSGGLLAGVVVLVPLLVAGAVLLPASVRQDYGRVITPDVRQRLSMARQTMARRAEAARQRSSQQEAAYHRPAEPPPPYQQPPEQPYVAPRPPEEPRDERPPRL